MFRQSALAKASLISFLLALSACQSDNEFKSNTATHSDKTDQAAVCPEPPPVDRTVITVEKPCNCPKPATPVCEKPTPAPTNTAENETNFQHLMPADWLELNLPSQDLTQAWPAWLQSCEALSNTNRWSGVCSTAHQLNQQFQGGIPNSAIVAFFTSHFDLFALHNRDGSSNGLVTGYYQPLLKGSRIPSAQYRYPLYHTPADLVTVSLAEQFPSLQHKRVRGRVENAKLTPYYTRAELETARSPIAQSAFLYLDDPIDRFFLHIQGSGVIALDSGETMQVGYDNHNGHPYHSIGKVLINRGELQPSQASMAGIKRWAKAHPDQLQSLLNENPSYVFFRELPPNLPGPLGALGVPLYAEQAIAVDKRYIPLGAPVFLSTTYPNTNRPLNKLMMAQDTGGAIKGVVRADFYWGAGPDAGAKAGSMKQEGQMWVLLPKVN